LLPLSRSRGPGAPPPEERDQRALLDGFPDRLSVGRLRDELFETRHRERERLLRRAEREADVVAEARRAAMTPLARVHVEELAGHRDHLLRQCRPKKTPAVVERRRQSGDVSPRIKRPVRRAIEADAEALEAREHAITLVAKDTMNGEGLLRHVVIVE